MQNTSTNIDEKIKIDEALKPEIPEKFAVNYYNKPCKCCGHDPNCKDCFCICSCYPWCIKYCYKRDYNKPIQTNTSDIDINILNKYNALMSDIISAETELINDLKNNKISIDEFHHRYDEIRELKSKMPKN